MKLFSPKSKEMIYLDYAAATPVDPRVMKKMAHVTKVLFANPSAIHKNGVAVRTVIEEARAAIAKAFFAHSDEIIFTGSGTESDALAILGAVRSYTGSGIPHIVTTQIEHSAVLENCRILEKRGEATVTYVSINEAGIVDPIEIKNALQENTILVSVMYANNEIGTIQPIQEIAKVIRHARKIHSSSFPFFHSDACQAINYLPTENIEKLGVDLLSWNSSKIYGPKGSGVLYKKRGVTLMPLYGGGGQEFGLRSGTENVASIVGTSSALLYTNELKQKEVSRLTKIRDYGIDKLHLLSDTSPYPIILNGDTTQRLPNNINISVEGISSELLVVELDARGIMLSAKSACKSDEPDESYVITALRNAQGKSLPTTDGSLRISLGRGTTKKHIDALCDALTIIFAKYQKWK